MDNVYLTGNYAPVEEEVTAFDLRVVGAVPPELAGRYVRNGPNPIGVEPECYHWFLGDGMVHGVRLGDGRAQWYRNRWVRTDDVRQRLGEPRRDDGIPFPANTSAIEVGGRPAAIVEGGAPAVELTADLDTVGRFSFAGESTPWFAAHPKRDPATGLWHAITYGPTAPFVGYKVVDPDGRVVHDVPLDIGARPMMHDAAITETHVLVLVHPVLFSEPLARAGHPFPYAWTPGAPATVGVLPLLGRDHDLTWCELPRPCYPLHAMNAFDREDDRIQLDVVVAPETMQSNAVYGPLPDDHPVLERWIIDPLTRRVETSVLDDHRQEFPRINETRTGRPARYGYSVWQPDITMRTAALLKNDLETGTTTVHHHGDHRATDEAVFVPRDGAVAEDDGWLLSYVFDHRSGSSELVVLHAQDLGGDPVARVLLPQRVPHGFHGAWFADR